MSNKCKYLRVLTNSLFTERVKCESEKRGLTMSMYMHLAIQNQLHMDLISTYLKFEDMTPEEEAMVEIEDPMPEVESGL